MTAPKNFAFKEREHKVYRISFADGTAYIGITSQKLAQRLSSHRYQGDSMSSALHKQFAAGLAYEVDLLAIAPDYETARQLEREAVLALDPAKRINTQRTLAVTPPDRKPRQDNREFVCSQCRIKKIGTEFPTDRTRFNGLNSRCNRCHSTIRSCLKHKTYRGIPLAGLTKSERYLVSKALNRNRGEGNRAGD